MDRQQLKATLQGLHEQLQRGEPVDPEVRELLQQLSTDVDSVAARSVGANPADAERVDVEQEKQTLLDRLFGLTDEFEESHPQLAEAIGRVATALSRIGI